MDGAKMLYAEFAAGQAQPFVELTSRVQTQGRAVDWAQKTAVREDADTLRYYTRPTKLLPTDGIVRKTAQEAIEGAKTDVEKPKRFTTGSWPTPTANPRCAAAAKATSRPCWKPATWAASAPT